MPGLSFHRGRLAGGPWRADCADAVWARACAGRAELERVASLLAQETAANEARATRLASLSPAVAALHRLRAHDDALQRQIRALFLPIAAPALPPPHAPADADAGGGGSAARRLEAEAIGHNHRYVGAAAALG